MGRGRILMELIQKKKARKTTFQKRKSGLMKKVYEFSTLCGVDVCVIIYAPNFEGQGLVEPETWPQDTREVRRIIQKYYNTTSDRRPKIYDVQEYFKERIKKVEVEISKVRKEKLKIMYPTWDDSFNALGEQQLRMFASMLDAKLDACNQKIDMLKGDDLKGKAIAESNMAQNLTLYLSSNPSTSSHLNLMQSMSQAQLFPPPMNMNSTSDNRNPLAFWPFQLGQSSQPSMLHFGQNGMIDWANQVGVVPKTSMLKEEGVENDQNSSPCYYNGNAHTIQPCIVALHTLPSQNSQYETAFQTLSNLQPEFQSLSNLPPGFQLNEFYDTDTLQGHMFNYMHGRK